MIRTPHFDDFGNRLYDKDRVKIGQLKGLYVVVWDMEFKCWRMKHENSNGGFGFGIPKYKIKKVYEMGRSKK
jgi:hypothetical protein